MHPVITCLLGGILPFGAVSVELFFIMSALWLHQVPNHCDSCDDDDTWPHSVSHSRIPPFVMSALWLHQIYYIFGFLFLVMIVLVRTLRLLLRPHRRSPTPLPHSPPRHSLAPSPQVATCAEISILLCYFQLCNEDHRWWWRSFLSSGACAGYTLLYAIWYVRTVYVIAARRAPWGAFDSDTADPSRSRVRVTYLFPFFVCVVGTT